MKDDIRTEILRASLDVMNETGLSGLSMREVARRAGVSHQAPYHYFPDREAILAELIGRGFDELHDYSISAIGHCRSRGQKARALGEAYIRFALDKPEIFKLMFRCDMCDLSRYPDARARADRMFGLVAQTLGAPVPGGSTDKGAPDLVPVIAAWSLAHGMATLLLEQKLGDSFGETRAQKEAAASRVIEYFGRLYPD